LLLLEHPDPIMNYLYVFGLVKFFPILAVLEQLQSDINGPHHCRCTVKTLAKQSYLSGSTAILDLWQKPPTHFLLAEY
jgi:hypothetical protein